MNKILRVSILFIILLSCKPEYQYTMKVTGSENLEFESRNDSGYPPYFWHKLTVPYKGSASSVMYLRKTTSEGKLKVQLIRYNNAIISFNREEIVDEAETSKPFGEISVRD